MDADAAAQQIRVGQHQLLAGHFQAEDGDALALVDRNEYKRKQAPPGLRVTSKAFGYGRRMPIAAKF